MSQTQNPFQENDRERIPDIPLTYMSASQLEIIDLHTNLNQMREKENEYLRKLFAKDAKIENLSKRLEQIVIALPAQ